MRLTQLVEELALKFGPESSAGADVSAAAARTTLVAQITALDAARAGSVGRGLQLAAEELHELSLLTSSQDQNIRSLASRSVESVTRIRLLFSSLGTDRWTSMSQLQQELAKSKEEVGLLVCDLVRRISSMPQSLGDYEAPQSADRVQIETLLRQALINGRDRLTAIEMVLDAMITCGDRCDDIEKLIELDSESLEYSVRQRLAGLTRDQQLDNRILTSQTSH